MSLNYPIMIEADLGEQVVIRLEGIPGAGYLWKSTAEGAEVEEDVIQPPDDDTIGGPVVTRFLMTRKAEKAEVIFTYKRPWMDASEDDIKYKVLLVDKKRSPTKEESDGTA